MKLSHADLEKLAAAYDLGADQGHTALTQEWAREQASRVHREFAKLERRVRVVFTERDPYQTFQALLDDVKNHKRMYVYTGSSETPLWDEKTNWMARAVHDWDHVEGGYDFSVEGELGAYRYSAKRAPGLSKLYLSEIALQAASSALAGGFAPGPQKLVLAPDEVAAIADRFTANGSKRSGSAALTTKDLQTEDLALVLARFLRPDEIAVHLGAKQVGKTLGVVATVGTTALAHKKRVRRAR